MKIALHHERRVRHQINPDGVGDPDPFQGRHLLPHPGSDAERFRPVGEELPLLQALEELGEDLDLPIPIAGGPYLAELRVEGLVELALEVGVVGGVSGSDLEIGGEVFVWVCCGGFVEGLAWGLDRDEGQERERNEEEEDDGFEDEEG